jgi:hypothetical protein
MGLTKPASSDPEDIGVLNANMDKLDGHRHGGGADGLRVQLVQAGGSGSVPGSHTPGQVYANTDTGLLLVDNGALWLGTGAMKIFDVVLSSASPSIDFTNIPQGFRHLGVTMVGRGDQPQYSFLAVAVQFNGDSGGNYCGQQIWATGTSLGGGEFVNATGGFFGAIIGSYGSPPTGAAGGFNAVVFDYARSTWRKYWSTQGFGHFSDAASGGQMNLFGGVWRSTAPVTSIHLFSGSGNFVAGTLAVLYGIA